MTAEHQEERADLPAQALGLYTLRRRCRLTMVAGDQGLGAREACQVVLCCLKAGHRACRHHCRLTRALLMTLALTLAASVLRTSSEGPDAPHLHQARSYCQLAALCSGCLYRAVAQQRPGHMVAFWPCMASVWQHTWSHLISAQVPQLHQTANRAALAACAIAAVLDTQQGIV